MIFYYTSSIVHGSSFLFCDDHCDLEYWKSAVFSEIGTDKVLYGYMTESIFIHTLFHKELISVHHAL
jgi:hypothetical protein